MSISGSRTYLRITPVPKMPLGLVDLMEGLSKEVLRNNPSDIYEFCSAHMGKLLEIRDGPAQEQLLLKVKFNKIQKKGEIRSEKCETSYERIISGKKMSEPIEEPIIQNKIPVSHDLIKDSEIEIAQKFTKHENIDKCTPTEIFRVIENDDLHIIDKHNANMENTEVQYMKFSNSVEVKENDHSDIYETNNINAINLKESTIKVKLTSSTEKETQIESLEGISSIVLDHTKFVDIQENIQSLLVNGMDTLEKDKTKVEEVLKEETYAAGIDITRTDNITEHHLSPLNHAENTLKISSHELESISQNTNELKSVSEETKTVIIDNSESSEVVQKAEQIQIMPILEYTKEKSYEIMVPNERNEFIYDNQSVVEKQSYIPLEIQEVLVERSSDIDISKKEVILKMDEHNKPIVKIGTNVNINNNDFHYVNTCSTNENNSVADDINIVNYVKKNENNDLEKTERNLHFENIIDRHILSENEDYNSLQVTSDNISNDKNKNVFINAQNVTEIDVDKQTVQNIKDIAATYSSEILPNHDFIVVNTGSIDNFDEKAGQNTKDSNNMNLETAAITIQKVFRSFMYKSRGSTFEGIGNDENFSNDKETDIYTSPTINKDRRPLGITRIDSVLQTVNEEKSLSLSTDDSSTLSSAATIIQAHVRGFLVRNKVNCSKTLSMNSLKNSDSHLAISSDNEDNQQKNKTVLNIHIVPEAENRSFNRDESILTSMDLSLDCSPPTSINLHPLGYDKSEPRKQLKREDAFQSISPPSNNSGKLSEDVDSVREIVITDNISVASSYENMEVKNSLMQGNDVKHTETVVEYGDSVKAPKSNTQDTKNKTKSLTQMSSDESDVVTPFVKQNAEHSVSDSDNISKLMHSGEYHDAILPTKVTRSNTSVARGE